MTINSIAQALQIMRDSGLGDIQSQQMTWPDRGTAIQGSKKVPLGEFSIVEDGITINANSMAMALVSDVLERVKALPGCTDSRISTDLGHPLAGDPIPTLYVDAFFAD